MLHKDRWGRKTKIWTKRWKTDVNTAIDEREEALQLSVKKFTWFCRRTYFINYFPYRIKKMFCQRNLIFVLTDSFQVVFLGLFTFGEWLHYFLSILFNILSIFCYLFPKFFLTACGRNYEVVIQRRNAPEFFKMNYKIYISKVSLYNSKFCVFLSLKGPLCSLHL